MSHHKRTERICLNCGAELHGHFCHVCGQENNEPRESAWHLIKHFAEDVTHFDGKFFSSLKYVLLKPGFMAQEYMKGRRVSYLNPIRMYLLYSAIFFLIVFSFVVKHGPTDPYAAHIRDSVEEHHRGYSVTYSTNQVPGTGEHFSYLTFDSKYAVNGVHVYDSIQKKLPDSLKDKGLERFTARRIAAIATVYHKDPNGFMEKLGEGFIHSFSKVFFVSLPLFALLLTLLYYRRKEFYFVAHSVFAIHYFCVVFAFALVFLLLASAIGPNQILDTIIMFTLMCIIVGIYLYLYIAMLRFYKQGWFKTLIKWLIQCVFFTITFILLSIALYLNSIVSLSA